MKSLLGLCFTLIAGLAIAQPQEAFEIEIKEGLDIEIRQSYTDFEVIGIEGNKVFIELYKGLTKSKYSSPPVRFDVDDNQIIITHSKAWTKNHFMKIWVPKTSHIKISSPFASKISVSFVESGLVIKSSDADIECVNVSGDIDINTFKGDISVENLLGSPILSTNNGDIDLSFKNLPENYPNIISSMYGNIAVSLNQSDKVSLRLKMVNNFDKIKTDFRLGSMDPKTFPLYQEGNYNYYRNINGGGVPLFIKTFQGKVELKKKE
ncbi:MAG: DUF2807 domain-containing protein [bacterium]|nr:DUF2807 domain-containing protein [bacterium]